MPALKTGSTSGNQQIASNLQFHVIPCPEDAQVESSSGEEKLFFNRKNTGRTKLRKGSHLPQPTGG